MNIKVKLDFLRMCKNPQTFKSSALNMKLLCWKYVTSCCAFMVSGSWLSSPVSKYLLNTVNHLQIKHPVIVLRNGEDQTRAKIKANARVMFIK